GVAPLKHGPARLYGLALLRFHAQLSVAPLKHVLLDNLVTELTGFPRSAERGSIEASLLSSAAPTRTTRFHAQLSVAPLKHRAYFEAIRSDDSFPRSAELGSIDA